MSLPPMSLSHLREVADMTCTKCGAFLIATDKFCTKCGTAHAQTALDPAPSNFCQSCGAAFPPADKFCAKCGATRNQLSSQAGSTHFETSVSSAPPSVAPIGGTVIAIPERPATVSAGARATSALPEQPPSTPPHESKKSSKLVFVIVVLMLFALTAISGIGYVAYRAKKKVDEVRQGTIANDIAEVFKSAKAQDREAPQGDGQSSQNEATDSAMKKMMSDAAEAVMKKAMHVSSVEPAKLPEWKAATAELVSSPALKVPLKASLRIVVTGTEARGDYESIFEVDSVTDQQIHINGHQQFPNRKDMNTVMAQNGPNGFNGSSLPAANEAVKIECSQVEPKADLENAASAPPYFCQQGRTDKFPGTTSLGFSKKIFADLKAGKDVSFVTYENPMNAMFKSFKDLASGSGDPADFLNRVLSAAPGGTPPPTPPIHVTLRRVGSDVAIPLILNEEPAQLPALHATGTVSDGTNFGDVFFLDDADNPLFLAAQTKINGTSQVTKISWNSEKSGNPIEQQLRNQGRAKVYGIYFDFGSNKLRPESEVVLAEITAAMKAHPDWKLRIEGHTDNIGGSDMNQALSSRRAEAVKNALMAIPRLVAGDRLTTAGFGDTRPVASNDTFEGRALNRRVELVRE